MDDLYPVLVRSVGAVVVVVFADPVVVDDDPVVVDLEVVTPAGQKLREELLE